MKAFHFPLDRVLHWRRTHCRIEESRLEQLHGEVHDIEARQTKQNGQRMAAELALLKEPVITGLQLAELDAFQRFSILEQDRLEHQRLECVQHVTDQIKAVAANRRKVRLLEQLREKNLTAWNAELGRGIDAEADEVFLAKWKPGAGK
jgi:flagellar export protein FliJ